MVDPGELKPGRYETTLRVTAPDLDGSPQEVPVTLVVALEHTDYLPLFAQ